MSVPAELQGKPIILIASLGVNPGKEARVEELIKAVHECANSSAEPGCKTYRFNRSVDKQSVVMYEEYADKEAIAHHRAQPAYQKLTTAAQQENLFSKFDVNFMEELK